MASAFTLLHTAVQRKLWDMKWTELRPIQDASIRYLLGPTPGDAVITSPTASGKTEAAFLPLLSALADEPGGSIRAMYIGPLKALINDQFRRLEELCERMEMPVCKWHGDVNDTAKKRLLRSPAGVLLITPESLEALLIRRPTEIRRLFGGLRWIVVDEMHAFMGTERGAQLVCQLHRLCRRAGCTPLRVGLSATLGEPVTACQWLRPGGAPARLLQDNGSEAAIKIRVRGFWRVPVSPEEVEADDETAIHRELARSILVATNGKTNLVFANRKSEIELLADALREETQRMGLRDEIVVHHGSLSRERRHDAEERLREAGACTAVCSNTLELGIDIGNIDEVIQVSAPWSTASLVQRVGRSGRRSGAPRILRGFFAEWRPDERSTVWDRLHLELLQGLATIERMLEGFIEPPRVGRAHLSTLVHQTLAYLAETGGARATDVYENVAQSGAFGDVSREAFAAVLRQLGARNLIEQMGDGTLIVGITGEKLVDHYSFYAAFNAPEEFRVVHRGDEIGTIPQPPPPGDCFVLAGQRWRVESIDVERREVLVCAARGVRAPQFRLAFGSVHPSVHAKMRDLLTGQTQPVYADAIALEILEAARMEARAQASFEPAAQVSDGTVKLFVFGGWRVQQTLHVVLARAGLDPDNRRIGFELDASPAQVKKALQDFVAEPNLRELARYADEVLKLRALSQEKYEHAVDPAVWQQAYAREELDEPRSTAIAAALAGGIA